MTGKVSLEGERDPAEKLAKGILRIAEMSVGLTLQPYNGGTLRVSTAQWAAMDGEDVAHIHYEHGEQNPWSDTVSRYRESYLVGRSTSFSVGDYPPLAPDLERSINVFYLSNCYTEMERWSDISRSTVKLHALLNLFTTE